MSFYLLKQAFKFIFFYILVLYSFDGHSNEISYDCKSWEQLAKSQKKLIDYNKKNQSYFYKHDTSLFFIDPKLSSVIFRLENQNILIYQKKDILFSIFQKDYISFKKIHSKLPFGDASLILGLKELLQNSWTLRLQGKNLTFFAGDESLICTLDRGCQLLNSKGTSEIKIDSAKKSQFIKLKKLQKQLCENLLSDSLYEPYFAFEKKCEINKSENIFSNKELNEICKNSTLLIEQLIK